jgi:protein-tyrosine phosphatase
MKRTPMGLVDLHCHLLWGVDDGCRAPEDSLAAARALVALGYEDVAQTPHARDDFPSRDAALCEARLAELEALLVRQGVPLRVHRGAENFLDEGFLERVARGEPRALGAAGRHVLVELPFAGAVPALPDLLFRIRLKGLGPLVAHPERCAEFERPGRAEEAVRLGAALQLDVGTLTGRYGRTARRLAERFLGDGLYAVAATDLHGPVEAERWVGDALEALERRAGAAGARRLCSENPRRLLAGEELA